MAEILNNPWVSGIGGGIISSLIVFFVTKYFFSKKEKREYLQKVETANNEILYSIRPLIIQKKLPTKDILDAVQISTAKKYGVLQEDLYNERSLSNDLIAEIMANSFLSSDQKLDFCSLLHTMKTLNEGVQPTREMPLDRVDTATKYNSLLLATTSFVMVVYVSFMAKTEGTNSELFFFKDKLSLVVSATVIPIVAMTIIASFKVLKKRKDKKEATQDKIDASKHDDSESE